MWLVEKRCWRQTLVTPDVNRNVKASRYCRHERHFREWRDGNKNECRWWRIARVLAQQLRRSKNCDVMKWKNENLSIILECVESFSSIVKNGVAKRYNWKTKTDIETMNTNKTGLCEWVLPNDLFNELICWKINTKIHIDENNSQLRHIATVA